MYKTPGIENGTLPAQPLPALPESIRSAFCRRDSGKAAERRNSRRYGRTGSRQTHKNRVSSSPADAEYIARNVKFSKSCKKLISTPCFFGARTIKFTSLEAYKPKRDNNKYTSYKSRFCACVHHIQPLSLRRFVGRFQKFERLA